MVSPLHEAVVRMVREGPELLRSLLRGRFALPDDARFEALDATVSPASSGVTRAVDLALVAHVGKQSTVVLVEVQLQRDPDKAWSWPLYVAHFAAARRTPCVLVVLALDATVARWARGLTRATRGVELPPIVVGPDDVPRVDSVEAARRDIDLALLSLFAHLRRPIEVALPVATAFFAALGDVDPERRTYYTDVALKTLESKAPRLGEQLMRPPPGYQLQSEWLRSKLAEGEARLLTRLLGRRFGALDDATLAKVASASMSELEAWGERLLFAATLEDVFRDPS